MSDREEAENMNIVNMRLAFNPDGGGAVYKPVMPTPQPPQPATTETYHHHHHQPDVSLFQQHHHHEQLQEHHQANSVSVSLSGLVEPVKRKRGRPRKYGPDGSGGSNGSALGINLSSPPPPSAVAVGSPSSNSYKKARGRPPGSTTRKQHSAGFAGSTGVGFTPHVITVQAGEDVLAKIMSFSQNGPRAVCILSANGAISNVTLRQAMTSGGTVTYEGRFEILSLSGSILLSESDGQRSRTGGLSVSLAGPDGRVLGGGVAGLLTAASPVQVIIGSFLAEGWKESKGVIQAEPLSTLQKLIPGASAVGSPPSRGNLSESSGGCPGSPFNHSTGGASNNNPQGLPNIWK